MRWLEAYAECERGELERAADCFQGAIAISRAAGYGWNVMIFLADLGHVARLRGQLTEAVTIFQENLRLADELGLGSYGYLSRVRASLASAWLEQNELDRAEAQARLALESTRWWLSPNHRALALVHLVSIRLARGDAEAAAEVYAQADDERHRGPVLPAGP